MAKSKYVKPRLVEYGSIVDLTAGNAGPGTDNFKSGSAMQDTQGCTSSVGPGHICSS